MKKTTIAILIALSMVQLGFTHDHKHDHEHEKPCTEKHNHEHKHDHEHEKPCTEKHQSSVEISEAAAKNAGIETVQPRERAAGSEFTFKGRFELLPEARDTIGTPVAGQLALKVASLQTVKKGETLFTVTSQELLARAKELEILEKRTAVYREIKTPNAELENRLALKQAELSAMLMGHEANHGTIELKAPKAGMIEEFHQLNGTWLEQGDAVLRLTDPTRLRFKGLLPASECGRLENGMPATVGGTTGSLRLGIGEASGLLPVYVIFENPPSAVIGERDTATVLLGGDGKMERTVPDDAIVEIDLLKHVFIRDAHNKNRFIAISVTAGASAGGWTPVTGLPDGACEVVSKGAYELKLAAAASGKNTAGHFHADGTFHEGEH